MTPDYWNTAAIDACSGVDLRDVPATPVPPAAALARSIWRKTLDRVERILAPYADGREDGWAGLDHPAMATRAELLALGLERGWL